VDSEKLSRAFLLLLLALVTALFLYMIRSLLGVILLAALASGLSYPLYRRVLRLLRGRRAAAAILTILFLLIVVVGPLSLILGLVAKEALHTARVAGPWVSERLSEPGHLLEALPGGDRLAPYEPEILRRAGEAVERAGSFLFGSISAVTRGTVAFLFRLFLFLYALFYFYLGGGDLLRRMLAYLPMTDEDKTRLADRFLSVTRATIKGTLVIGLVQGTLAGIAFAIAGIDSPLFWGALMILLSTIPGVGTAVVWLPAGVILLASGRTGEAVFLLLFCGLVVSSVDNLMRPKLVGRDTKMHPLLVLFSTIGGLFLFGVIGFLVGPIVGALFVTVWDIATLAFRERPREEGPGV